MVKLPFIPAAPLASPLAADRETLARFVNAMFRYADRGTFASLRGFPDGRSGPPIVIAPHELTGDLVVLIEDAVHAANTCAQHLQPAVFCPPVATFANRHHARETDLANGLALSVECDTAPNAARVRLESLLGAATVIVASGGEWPNPVSGEIEPKLHLHWRLTEPTRDAAEHARLKVVRAMAARLVGADVSNTPAVHPIRWPGSWHRKGQPRLAGIVALNEAREIDLSETLETLQEAAAAAGVLGLASGAKEAPTAGTGEARDMAELIRAVMTAEDYHAPLAALAMRYLKGGMPDGQVVLTLRGVMEAVPEATRDVKAGAVEPGRWQSRYDDIPRAVSSARAKVSKTPANDGGEWPIPDGEPHPAAALLAKLDARSAEKQKAPLPVSADLMDVPGALKMFVEHCEATAISPQPFLALAAGITLIGTLAGRRYCTTTNLRTNIYAVGIADSGAGKDHARRVIKRCLHAANLSQYLGGSDIASGSGLRTALARHPAMLFQIDEFGDWMISIISDKAGSHRKQIAAMLKELYSSASGPWQGTEYADQTKMGRPREDIHDPHACFYGTTTPGQFWNAIAGASLHDGLMARMLLFVSPCSYPDEQEPILTDPPPALIEALQAIARGAGAGNLADVMMADMPANVMMVPETPEASDARRAMRQDQLQQQREAEGTYVTAIAGRLAENAMKLALIRAVSRDPGKPVIDVTDVAWGRALAQHCVDTLLRDAGRHVGDTDFERKMNLISNTIRNHSPISGRDLLKKIGSKTKEIERNEIIRTLEYSGKIKISRFVGTKGGRPTEKYEWIDWD